MKKILSILLTLILCLGVFVSCNNETPNGSSNESEDISVDTSTDTTTKSDETDDTIQTLQTKKYYREISSGYSRTCPYDVDLYYKNGKVFSDGIFEANQASQYKVISSQSELQAFSLLNHDEVETDVFDNNYYVSNKNVKENIEILDTVRESSYPYIAIHLDKVIETDYIANNFKYENGEIYITIEIFEKTEMTYLHEVPSNLLIVSLRSVVFEEDKIGEPENTLDDIYDDISPDCKINVTFENVVAMDN